MSSNRTDSESRHRCGVVVILGAPNVGKSTLLNAVVGQKVSIVTPKVQTTRARVRGIAIEGDVQIVFTDTPGIFSPRRRFDRAMVKAAWSRTGDADLILVMVDARKIVTAGAIDEDTRRVLAGLAQSKPPAFLVINKVDAVTPHKLLWLVKALNDLSTFDSTFMISALKGDGLADLMAEICGRMPEGPWLFPEDQVSDQPTQFFATEITREKLFLRLRQELPYALTVETELWTENKDGSVRIDQTIYVERESQKPIIVGKGGRQIKEIGQAARQELERFLDRRVHLFLHVKTRENWAEQREHFRSLDLDYDA